MNERDKLALAKRKVEAMTGFYMHLATFVAVMTLLLIINVVASGGWWVQWPFLGWIIGIAGHGWAVFGETPNVIRQWQMSKIEELKQKL